MTDPRKFFVRHLPMDDRRRQKGHAYQIQLVDRSGVAIAFTYVSADQTAAELSGVAVPAEVIDTVRALPPGRGEFLRADGRIIAPKELLDS